MNEQRRQILQMLAEGKITTDEAERLMTPSNESSPNPRREPRPARNPDPGTCAWW